MLPPTLFARALITLIATFGIFTVLTFVAIVNYALAPVAKRSAEDFTSLMLLSTRTLVQLPEEIRDDYRERLDKDYGLLLVSEQHPPPQLEPYFFPYLVRLEDALERRLNRPVPILSHRIEGKRWFWVELFAGGQRIWAGFPRDRIDTHPLQGLLIILGSAVVLVLLTAAVLARRVTSPLTALARAAEDVALGQSPNPLPETGPRELASLARQFNHTSRQVNELLSNRTLMLAGISHDLRTPLTRLRLSLEMLPEDTDKALLTRMERDIDQMNTLISESVELGRTLGAGRKSDVELNVLIKDLVAHETRILWLSRARCRCRINELALRRILGNLIENALRYSNGIVEVHLDCRLSAPVIFVLDRGPGVPEHEREAVFRPFYRLEHSRNRRTGGTGLGLAIARQLAIANDIELHLGNRKGGGSIVSVRLSAC